MILHYLIKFLKKNYYAKRIDEISKKPEEALDFLNTIVTYRGTKYTLGNHIFYFGLSRMPKNNDDVTIEQNLNVIKKGLILLAKDLADTREYNSYKHGLRIFPLLKEFGLGFNEQESSEHRWNLSDSMTFYHRDDKQKKVHFVTKPFDTVRDINMTAMCSSLIGNIILLRKRFLVDVKTDPPISYFTDKNITHLSKINVDWTQLSLSIDLE